MSPVINRMLWYYPQAHEHIASTFGEPLPAIICKVWSTTMVNLAVFDANGIATNRTSVEIKDTGYGDAKGGYAKWPEMSNG